MPTRLADPVRLLGTIQKIAWARAVPTPPIHDLAIERGIDSARDAARDNMTDASVHLPSNICGGLNSAPL